MLANMNISLFVTLLHEPMNNTRVAFFGRMFDVVCLDFVLKRKGFISFLFRIAAGFVSFSLDRNLVDHHFS